MGHFKQHLEEPQRQEFQGEIGIDDLTGQVKKHKDNEEQNFVRRMFSHTAVAIFIGLVIAVTVAIFLYRATVKNTS
jgi:acid phosphatase family membrane protein YuiD